MDPVNRTVPDDGHVICHDCGGSGICVECDGAAKVDGKLCRTCSGRRYCVFCKHTGQVVPRRGSTTKKAWMLEARTAYECRLYIELHPHDCGETAFPARSQIGRTDQGLVATYEGLCPKCGKPRSLEFLLDPELEPPPPAFGGAKPSKIIDPGEFLAIADGNARQAPDSVADLSVQAAQRAQSQLAVAAAALAEVLKFIPPGQDEVPASAFVSAQGKQMRAREPGRFDRARLEAVRDVYRRGLDGYQRELAIMVGGEDRAHGP